jgi:hypothetical protein
MSHFTVTIIGTNVEEQLEPFNENIVMEKYVKFTKEALVADERKNLEDYKNGMYARYLIDPVEYKKNCANPAHLQYLEDFPKLLETSDEDIYNKAMHWYDPEDITENGSVLSTYNPKSKWDWYQIGGRWSGMLKLKNSVEHVDSANMDAIDWEALHLPSSEIKKLERKYLLLTKEVEPVTEEEKEMANNLFYKPGYYIERYGTPEAYAIANSSFHTFAILKDGEWFEEGEMEMFGSSSETPEEGLRWETDFYKTFIENLPDDEIITIVDCHI